MRGVAWYTHARRTHSRKGRAMVEELRQAFERAQQQPEDVQRYIAEMVALALEEREWDALVQTPESQRFLAELSAEVDREIADGTTRDLDELL